MLQRDQRFYERLIQEIQNSQTLSARIGRMDMNGATLAAISYLIVKKDFYGTDCPPRAAGFLLGVPVYEDDSLNDWEVLFFYEREDLSDT